MARKRRVFEAFSLSFLDVVSCAFGAIVLLLILSKTGEPVVIERVRADFESMVSEREERLYTVRGESVSLNRELDRKQGRLTQAQQELAELEADLSRMRGEHARAEDTLRTQSTIEGKLSEAKQELTEEMRRLAAQQRPQAPANTRIGGIPVDSEYIVFIIDTSGSMREAAWPLVRKKMAEVLDIYPRVRGIQVMNDMGEFMFSSYASKWIPDSPARRRAILNRLRTWSPFSNSSPVEGIVQAIRTFYAADKKISLYVFGDEFSRGSLEAVLKEVDAINKKAKQGKRRVRIHAVGFPTQFLVAGPEITGVRFAALMRILAERNGGSFVGLNALR